MDFSKGAATEIQINEKSYVIHDFIFAKAGIFKVFTDIPKSELAQPIEPYNFIIPGASNEDVSQVLEILYSNDFNKSVDIHNAERIIKIMVHMTFNDDLLNKCIKKMLDNKDIITELSNLFIYHDCWNMMFENGIILNYDKDRIITTANDLQKNSIIPDNFKIKMIMKMICKQLDPQTFDIVMGITSNFDCDVNRKIKDIMSVFVKNKQVYHTNLTDSYKPVKEIYKKYTNIEPIVEYYYVVGEMLKFSIIKVNKQEIKLVGHENTVTKGTVGHNIMLTIVTHISEILLGLKKMTSP